MSKTPKKLSERLDHALEKGGLRPADLARGTGLTPSYISLLRSGKNSNPSEKALEKMAKVLNVSVEWLSSGKGDMKRPPDGDRVQESGGAYAVTETAGHWPPGMTDADMLEFGEMLAEKLIDEGNPAAKRIDTLRRLMGAVKTRLRSGPSADPEESGE